jgi:DNA-binding NarL/FixJ family response regulator
MGPSILFIDDHPAVRRGLLEILSSEFQQARFGEAGDGDQALEQLKDHRWDIAILDLNLPGRRPGLGLIRDLKDLQPDVHILVFSVHSEEHFGLRAFLAGADGYLVKDQPPEEIAKAVRCILDGGHYISRALTAAMMTGIMGEATGAHNLLSDREMQVLRMLAAGKTPSEIGSDLALSTKTVSTYRARLLDKLNLRSNADLVRYAVKEGIVE